MAAPIKLSRRLIQRIESGVKGEKEPLVGFLFGHWRDDCLQIVGCYKCLHHTKDSIAHNLQEAAGFVPVGISLSGIFFYCPKGFSKEKALREVRMLTDSSVSKLENKSWPDHMVLYLLHEDSSLEDSVSWYHLLAKDISDADVEYISLQYNKECVLFRIHGKFDLSVDYCKKRDNMMQNIANQLQQLINKVYSSHTALFVRDSSVILELSEEIPYTCAELLEYIEINEDDILTDRKKRRRKRDFSKDVVNCDLIFHVASDDARKDEEKYAPVIYQNEGKWQCFTVSLPIDVVGCFHPNEPMSNVIPSLISGISDQLASMGRNICQFYKDGQLFQPIAHHFLPENTEHIITAVYPGGFAEKELENYRRMIHQKFMLPLDRPLLRPSNRFIFADELSKSPYLINVHIGLPVSEASLSKQYLVRGNYAYHHYMQDKFNDNGWGCAYRSLQTLISWFNLNGYTNVSIPTHKEIQEALVNIGDKEESFINSKKWIGSTEVSYCLDHLIQVTSKIMFVSSGAELGSRGRELSNHFETQGTPIMIGGGVLAHTILGVEFDDVTGDLKFLILDPHYTGAEDLTVIQNKGWCGWKGPDFWDKTAYYNLCLPQRPLAI